MSLLRFLALAFQICEVGIGLGLVGVFLLFPYATRLVENHHGDVGLIVREGSPSFYINRSVDNHDVGLASTFINYGAQVSFGRSAHAREPGNITLGPFRFQAKDGGRVLQPAGITAENIAIGDVSGTITFHRPPDAAEILAAVRWPFIASVVCSGGLAIVILELLSRMFRQVHEGDAFTPHAIRRVRILGLAFIAWDVLRIGATAWFKHAMAAEVLKHAALGGLRLDSSTVASGFGIVTGLVILALAEIFRQGILLRQENELTI